MKAKSIYQRVEFGIATIVAVCFIMALLIMSKQASSVESYRFYEYNIKYNFWKHLFVPGLAQVVLFYAAFVLLNKFANEKKDDWAKAGTVFGSFLIVGTFYAITNTYMDGWKMGKFADKDDFYTDVFTQSFTTTGIIFILYVAYYILKEILFGLIEHRQNAPKKDRKFFTIFLVLATWIMLIILFAANNSTGGILIFVVVPPYLLALYIIHVKYLIKVSDKKLYLSSAYWLRVLPIVFLLSIVAAAICCGIAGNSDLGPPLAVFFFTTLFLVLPIIWYILSTRMENTSLKNELGSSRANLSFLRSQINPHFLFNALNTLYGTALQENADRTSEGIQKLGDMMRFMLHENMQEKISLAREIDYLNNYIDLQKLRTATSPNIIIQTNIEEQFNRLDISPMLLIPFVENAFKHGISLLQPSFINISLHTKENVLYFDINNSVHLKGECDPEKMKSGIGLQNVKQRLALLYPKKHELIIRESAKEFFVHLTINL